MDMEIRYLMVPEIALSAASIVISVWLESRRLLGAEVIVLAALTYGVSGAATHAPNMVLPWSVLTVCALAYFSKWKDRDSEVPLPWLSMRG